MNKLAACCKERRSNSEMLVKAITITLVVFTIAGSLAEVTDSKLADAALNYLSLESSSTKGSLLKIQLLDLTKKLSALIDNLNSVNVEDLQNKVTVFVKLIQAQMTPDLVKLQLEVQKDSEQLRTKLSPYSDAVNKQLSKTTAALTGIFTFFDEELQALLQKSNLAVSEMMKNIALDLDIETRANPGNMQLSLASYSQRLEITITETLKELSESLLTSTEKVNEKIDQQVLTLYQSLSPFADDMQDNLRKQTENMKFQIKKNVSQMVSKILNNTALLKKQMSLYTVILKEESNLEFGYAKKTLDRFMTNMSLKVVEFKAMATTYRDILKEALVKSVADLKQKLINDAVSEQDQMNLEILEKDFLDKISKFINGTLLPAGSE
ncbi:apolipoprotein A-IV-like [Pseudophryne corroboree]|uniref:apolipoprotein A-IV-like n=1 Tax=Pseudophryne corroboree TaxID=495146 RepID=UPI0030821733